MSNQTTAPSRVTIAFTNHFAYLSALELLKRPFDGSVCNFQSRAKARTTLQAWMIATEKFAGLGDNALRRGEVDEILAQPIDVPSAFADMAADRMDAECDLHGITDAGQMSAIFAKHLTAICCEF